MRRTLILLPFLALLLMVPSSTGQDAKKKRPPAKPSTATDPTTLKVAKGFKVELLYSVPKDKEGSWVNLCVDPKGRLITCDQDGPLYRLTPPPLGSTEGMKVEKMPAEIGSAQGLLWAFDALYVMVNGGKVAPGLYRVTSSKNDDTLDKVEQLLPFKLMNNAKGGEHGPHAILLHPDGKRLTLVCGNQTDLPKYDSTKVPPVWGDDHLLPRMPDGNGFMAGRLGPGGFMVNVEPNGKNVELFSVGFRNQFDAAYNRDGDLFSYDADMEWDMNTPWYRPTRVCHVIKGSDFGWRNGAGKYPPYYPDNLPGICDIGPGSPTGVCFGYGAKFPAKYQNAFFISDWSYGKLYAVHIESTGATYRGTAEEFIAGTPLPLTDVVVNPKDGAMYFTIGGRKTQSGLYRVTYTGDEKTQAVDTKPRSKPEEYAFPEADLFRVRAGLEVEMGSSYERIAGVAAEYLASPDRTVRYVARTVLEGMSPGHRRDQLNSGDVNAVIASALLLARASSSCPGHDPERKGAGSPEVRGQILTALEKIDFTKLTVEQKLDLIRVYHILFHRFGPPTADEKTAWFAKFDPVFPTKNRYVDGELLQVYVYLEAPKAAELGMKLLANAPTQEEQMEYARALRVLKTGWTPDLRKQYGEWLVSANHFRGGNSLKGFMGHIRNDFVKTLSADEKAMIEPLLKKAAAGPEGNTAGPPRAIVKKYTLDELAPKLEAGLKGGRDFDHGRKLFGEARCFGCHRFDNDGSAFGPDLSGVAGRFSQKDLLESVIDPSKEVSDQYAATQFELEDGGQVVGRIINLSGDTYKVNTDMLDPNKMVNVNRNNIAKMAVSKTSMMPTGLLDTLKEDEVLDLMAYLLSRGDRGNAMFKK